MRDYTQPRLPAVPANFSATSPHRGEAPSRVRVQMHPIQFTDGTAVFNAEMWDPATGNFTVRERSVAQHFNVAIVNYLPERLSIGNVITAGRSKDATKTKTTLNNMSKLRVNIAPSIRSLVVI